TPSPLAPGTGRGVGRTHTFFQLLKRERIKRKIYSTREDARSDVFDYIEMFYNAKRRHGFNNQLSPVEFEKRYAMSLQGV
ncbi:IS3 family transposase, partial [Pseudomonas aeruginosa]|uniref:IS3 family transposase n=1 Tax=Pseudomonas aeruginosa TaxID=287 RepID=UPI001F4B7F96